MQHARQLRGVPNVEDSTLVFESEYEIPIEYNMIKTLGISHTHRSLAMAVRRAAPPHQSSTAGSFGTMRRP